MLRNLSYNNKEITKGVNEYVGRNFSFIERVKMGGNGSRRMMIDKASDEISTLLGYDNNMNFCNVELRPNGIILRFRSLLETFGLVISYQDLSMSRSFQSVTIFCGEEYVVLKSAPGQHLDTKFIDRICEMQSMVLTRTA